jgi:uncharacterized membrane protein YfcA
VSQPGRFVLILVIGFAAGIMSGLFGVGGGIVMVPMLVGFLGLSQHRAHATSLLAIIPIATVSAATFASSGRVDVPVAVSLLVGSLGGAPVGARVMARSGEGALRTLFGILISAVGLLLVLDPHWGAGGPVALTPPAVAGAVLDGFAVGVLSALFGVGGGPIMIPYMVLALGFTQQHAEGTSLLVIVPTALAGVIAHRGRGFIDFREGGLLGLGGVLGGYFGAVLALKSAPGSLQAAFGAFMCAVAIQMVVTGLGKLRAERRAGVAGA